ncbi:DUF1156 domain-containing protein [Candidatus Sumerlaeota bacterium]|nr:DUF1156 domain-containing protein [Candidatus Sumerlaeota bacterium]
MTDTPRLIERAFPLKQVSLTPAHERNVRYGHISTLHIWLARRGSFSGEIVAGCLYHVSGPTVQKYSEWDANQRARGREWQGGRTLQNGRSMSVDEVMAQLGGAA